jgi:hypothetical protein
MYTPGRAGSAANCLRIFSEMVVEPRGVLRTTVRISSMRPRVARLRSSAFIAPAAFGLFQKS